MEEQFIRTLQAAYWQYVIETFRQQLGLVYDAAKAIIENAVNAFRDAGLIK